MELDELSILAILLNL